MVTNQAYLFLIFMVNGLFIGLLFDFFRIIRKVFPTNDLTTYMEDILFWIIAGFLVLYSIFVFNNGEIRFFMFLGIVLGFVIYLLSISSYIIKINVKIIQFLQRIFRIFLTPFRFVYQFLKGTFFKPVHFLLINLRKSFTNFGIKTYHSTQKLKKEKNIVKN